MDKKIKLRKTEDDQADISSKADDFADREYSLKTLRVILVVFGLIFTMLLAVATGGGLALWDMGKTPSDLVAAITGKGTLTAAASTDENTGDALTFIDADDEASADGKSEDTALTFIDANDVEEDDAKPAEENGEAAEDGETADSAVEGNLDPMADAVTEAEDGTVIVSAELSGVPSIVKAGTNQALTVVPAGTALTVNPNEGYPLPFTAVDESYFNDALFIGDSRFYGFMMWSGIPGANYCATSFNIFQYETFKVVQTGNGKVPIFNALPYNAFSKIYIKVGLNEMGNSEEKFEAKYAELIARLREMEPRAIIYIHAVLPVTAAKSASDRTHCNPNIVARNASLKEFARSQQCYFIDAGPVLSDDSGCLRPEMTGDGIHLSSRYMGVWKQYLMENAVVVPE